METCGKERYKEIIQRKYERNHRRAVLCAKREGICINCLENTAFPGRLLCKECLNKDYLNRR